MPISSEAKINLLVGEYGFKRDDAENILQPEGEKNEQLEILQSMSPLMANKLIEKMNEEEVRTLLNL